MSRRITAAVLISLSAALCSPAHAALTLDDRDGSNALAAAPAEAVDASAQARRAAPVYRIVRQKPAVVATSHSRSPRFPYIHGVAY